MLRKLTELKLGANPTEQLQRMRERVYLISRLEKNDLKDTRPKWLLNHTSTTSFMFSVSSSPLIFLSMLIAQVHHA